MQITEHVYSTHIVEDQNTFGAMHPGGTQIYFVGDPRQHMVMIDSGEPYRSWTKQILEFHAELGRPRISGILITHSHGDHIGGLDRLQEAMDCPVRCHPKLEDRLVQRLGSGSVVKLRSREQIPVGGGASIPATGNRRPFGRAHVGHQARRWIPLHLLGIGPDVVDADRQEDDHEHDAVPEP